MKVDPCYKMDKVRCYSVHKIAAHFPYLPFNDYLVSCRSWMGGKYDGDMLRKVLCTKAGKNWGDNEDKKEKPSYVVSSSFN